MLSDTTQGNKRGTLQGNVIGHLCYQGSGHTQHFRMASETATRACNAVAFHDPTDAFSNGDNDAGCAVTEGYGSIEPPLGLAVGFDHPLRADFGGDLLDQVRTGQGFAH